MSSRQASKAARQNPAFAAGATSHKAVERPKSDISVLRNEPPSYFEKLKNLCYEKVQLEDQVETRLVEGTVAARWRIDGFQTGQHRSHSGYSTRLRDREANQNLRNDPKSGKNILD
jgi:hypothetical protein